MFKSSSRVRILSKCLAYLCLIYTQSIALLKVFVKRIMLTLLCLIVDGDFVLIVLVDDYVLNDGIDDVGYCVKSVSKSLVL